MYTPTFVLTLKAHNHPSIRPFGLDPSDWELVYYCLLTSSKVLIISSENFSSLKKTPCRVRVEEIKPISGEPPAWKVIVFQILSESADLAIHTHEGIYGRSPSSLKDVLQRVFIQSCQEECYLWSIIRYLFSILNFGSKARYHVPSGKRWLNWIIYSRIR